MTPLGIIAAVALAVVVIGWLAVSFSSPGRRRTVIEWIAATALYLVLMTIFVRGLGWAREVDSTAGLIGFGFLCVLFGGGLVVSAVNIFRSRKAERGRQSGATN